MVLGVSFTTLPLRMRKYGTFFYIRFAPKVYYLFRQKQKEFEDTKGVIRIRKSKKNRQHNDQKRTKGQTTIYKTYT
jgi:hypothetical protein